MRTDIFRYTIDLNNRSDILILKEFYSFINQTFNVRTLESSSVFKIFTNKCLKDVMLELPRIEITLNINMTQRSSGFIDPSSSSCVIQINSSLPPKFFDEFSVEPTTYYLLAMLWMKWSCSNAWILKCIFILKHDYCRQSRSSSTRLLFFFLVNYMKMIQNTETKPEGKMRIPTYLYFDRPVIGHRR